jgi:hypothetical protein
VIPELLGVHSSTLKRYHEFLFQPLPQRPNLRFQLLQLRKQLLRVAGAVFGVIRVLSIQVERRGVNGIAGGAFGASQRSQAFLLLAFLAQGFFLVLLRRLPMRLGAGLGFIKQLLEIDPPRVFVFDAFLPPFPFGSNSSILMGLVLL